LPYTLGRERALGYRLAGRGGHAARPGRRV